MQKAYSILKSCMMVEMAQEMGPTCVKLPPHTVQIGKYIYIQYTHTHTHTNKLLVSYIELKLKYNYQVWSLHLKKHKGLIEKVQRRSAKMVPKFRGKLQKKSFWHVNLPTLEERIVRGDLISIFMFVKQ